MKVIDWKTQPLGKMTDKKLAKKLKVCTCTVREYRRKYGIPVYQRWHPHIDWKGVELGEVADWKLAERLGVCVETIRSHRKKFGIKPHKEKEQINWKRQPLGKMSDQNLADKLGVGVMTVHKYRNILGIKPYTSSRRYLSNIGRRQKNIEKMRAKRKRLKIKINWDEVPFGKARDTVLAELFGTSVLGMRYQRLKRGIPICRVDYEVLPFGMVSDRRLGKGLNLNSMTIYHERKKRGIKPIPRTKYFAEYKKKNRKEWAEYLVANEKKS